MENKRYKPNKKNNGHPPICEDTRKLVVPIGCGQCIECRKKRANNWRVRITEELKHDPDAAFIGLTLTNKAIAEIEDKILKKHTKFLKACKKNNIKVKKKTKEWYPDANDVATQAIRDFLENYRYKTGHSIKHIFFTELGQTNTERIHLHGIVWEKSNLDIKTYAFAGKNFKKSEILNQCWKHGNVWIGDYCNAKTANYMIKYITKSDPKHPEFYSKVLISKGLGKNYIQSYDAKKRNQFKNTETDETYRLNNGFKTALPMYYRHHLFTEEQRDKLWTNLLDKQTRHVMGHKIDVSTPEGMKSYFKCCEYYRKIDQRNGNTSTTYKYIKDRIKYRAMVKDIDNLTRILKDSSNVSNKEFHLITPNRRSFEKSDIWNGCRLGGNTSSKNHNVESQENKNLTIFNTNLFGN